jgi:tetratricopeptide (TPR) repeat protein
MYAGLGRYNELEPMIESLLKENPDNIEIKLVAATTYERNKSDSTVKSYTEKAALLYKEILTIEPANYDANYNLGVLYYNEAVDLINKNDVETDLEQLGKILEKSARLFELSLPYLLKIFNPLKPDVKLLTALKAIYYNLNMKPEFNAISLLITSVNK